MGANTKKARLLPHVPKQTHLYAVSSRLVQDTNTHLLTAKATSKSVVRLQFQSSMTPPVAASSMSVCSTYLSVSCCASTAASLIDVMESRIDADKDAAAACCWPNFVAAASAEAVSCVTMSA